MFHTIFNVLILLSISSTTIHIPHSKAIPSYSWAPLAGLNNMHTHKECHPVRFTTTALKIQLFYSLQAGHLTKLAWRAALIPTAAWPRPGDEMKEAKAVNSWQTQSPLPSPLATIIRGIFNCFQIAIKIGPICRLTFEFMNENRKGEGKQKKRKWRIND